MRKCINVLQATFAAYSLVNEENVYLCTGKPLPSDINEIVTLLLNSTFVEAFQDIQKMQKLKGLSLIDIIQRVHEFIVRTSMPPSVLGYVLDELSNIEHRLAFGTSDRLQLGALVGVFQIAKERIVAAGA
jgi:replication factor C subunit 3/5